MAGTAIADTGFLIALLDRRDNHHSWAVAQASQTPPPWQSCEAVLSEAFHLVPRIGVELLVALVRRRKLLFTFSFAANSEPIIMLMQKYAGVPMDFADACLVRMTELLPDPLVLTTDADFRVYRRHSRQVVPCALPR
jgi:predicted nucleic acid-binding protein